MLDDAGALRFAAERNAQGLRLKALGRFNAARAEYGRALAAIQASPTRHRQAEAALCHNLGGIEFALGRYCQAESFARLGLALRREDPSSLPSEIAADLNALAAILEALGRLPDAEAMYCEALAALEDIRATDPQKGDGDRLRGDIQQQLMTLSSIVPVAAPDREKGERPNP